MTDLSHHLARRLDRIRTIPGGHGVTSRGRRFALAGLLASLVLGCTTASRQAPRDQRPRSVGSPTLELSAQPVAAPGAGYARELSSTFQAVSEEVGPAVVSVRAFSRRSRRFARQQGSGVLSEVRGERGIVDTNNHVVKDSSTFHVHTSDGRRFDARLVGTDPATDLAVLEIRGEGLGAAAFEQPDVLAVGEWVLAMGNPYGLGHTVTAGVVGGLGVSGLDIASFEDFIQTDAAINPGNSGGPLVNLEGKVVGINTAIGTEEAGTVGIAYAIPARIVRKVVRDLLNDGEVIRGWFGMRTTWLSSSEAARRGYEGRSRVLLRSVEEESPAAVAGLRAGDVLVGIGPRSVSTRSEATTLEAETQPGRPVRVQVWRGARLIELSVVPVKRPKD